MLSAIEWERFLRQLVEQGLADPEDIPRLDEPPLSQPEVLDVLVERPRDSRLDLEINRSSLEVRTLHGEGLLAGWNAANPTRAVRQGDRLLEVNTKNDPVQMRDLLDNHRGQLNLRLARDGMDACGLLRWLSERFHGESQKRFDKAAEAFRAAVHGVNVCVSYRGLENLDQRELYTYQVLLSEYEHAVAGGLQRALGRIRNAEEDVAPLPFGLGADAATERKEVGALDPGPLPTTPEEFQWTRGPEIERRLREIRIPVVAFLKGERVLERTEWGMRRLIAIAVNTEEEVEVLEVPWDVPQQHAHRAAELSNRIEALKQLTLSQYFLDYLGCDLSSHSGVGLHYLPLKQGICLRQLVKEAGPLKSEIHPLFQYWSREILLGLRDYLYQCCQELTEDLTLQHVYVHQEGLQVLLRGLPFGERRGVLMDDLSEYGPQNKWRNGFVPLEHRLTSMFGGMLFELLYGEQRLDSLVQTLQELSPGLRLLISHALNARDTLDHFMLEAGSEPQKPPGEEASLGPAAGLVAAGYDEFNDGSEYKLWWARPTRTPVRVFPNPDRTADASDALDEDWRRDEGEGVTEQAAQQLRWVPNFRLTTIQALLDNPALMRYEDGFPALMDAWDSYCRRFQAGPSRQARLERFLNGSLL